MNCQQTCRSQLEAANGMRSSIARRAIHGLLALAAIVLSAALLASCVASSNPSTSGVGSEQQMVFAGAGPSTGAVQQAAFRGGGSGYRIGPFDVLDISVFEVPELTKSVQVTDAGTINLPLVGELRVAGRTPQDVERELTQRLGADYLQNPQVTVFVKEYNSQTVTISGAVKKPGVYPIRGKTSLLQMVAMAGDFDVAADSNVLILRENGGKRMAGKFDVADIQKGNAEDPILQAGDQIVAGSSFMRKGFNAILKAVPIVGTFALL